jgi:hypothetical protein
LNMVSYPYSVSAKLANFDISNATSSDSVGSADKVLVWTGTGYDNYYLCNSTGPGYVDTAWSDVAGVYGNTADVDMSIGKGVWYNAQATTTDISATKPY